MHVLNGWNRLDSTCVAHKKKAKACNSAGPNNATKCSKQNVANCFSKVRNHAQFFTLNTSGTCCCWLRIKNLLAVSKSKFLHVSVETWSLSETFHTKGRIEKNLKPRAARIGRAKKGHHVRGCSVFHPKSSEERKKIITSADVQFFTQNQVKEQKKVITYAVRS